jgi:hypothetical protein
MTSSPIESIALSQESRLLGLISITRMVSYSPSNSLSSFTNHFEFLLSH